VRVDITTKRLDYLPIIGHALKKLGVAQIIDTLVPPDPRSHASTGECVEALIVAILHGKHTLSRIDDLFAPFDLELAFGWTATDAQFHDDRLGRGLDALFEAGPTKVYSAAILRAVAAFELELKLLHSDTTSVSVYGEYESSEEADDPDDEHAAPHVTRGHSKDHRADLKQVVFGVTVTGDGGVPIFGRVASGNRADVEEMRWLLGRLAEALPSPAGSTLVGDSKFFSGETLLLARKHGFNVVTMLPRNVGVWGEAYSAYRRVLAAGEPLTSLKVVYPDSFDDEAGLDEKPEPEKEWRGRSFDVKHSWKDEETKVNHELLLRALVVESTTLRDQKTPIVHARRDKERKALDKIVARLRAREFECEADAHRAAAAAIERHGPELHRLTMKVVSEEVAEKRPGPGRPRADETRPTRTVWRAVLEVEHDDHDVQEAILRESCFVIVTTLSRDEVPDDELFRTYQEQNQVEVAMRHFKNPLAVAPIFLKSPERIAALGLVYVLAIMVYVLIQREVRRILAARDEVFPGNKGLTARPTTEVVFRLFEGIDTMRIEGQPGVIISNMSTAQRDALVLLDHALLKDPRVNLGKLREPRPRRRGWRWKPKTKGDAD
jgi:transposase